MCEFRLPNTEKRLAVVGSTGSGKTFADVWHLSLADFSIPWIIFDFKHDKLINELGATEISIGSRPPTKAGLYVVRPIPQIDDDLVTAFLWQVLQNENTGLYFDEGYMIGAQNPAFRSLLTQGRSKHIPMIILSQRPVWMDRFVFSEADFFQIFRLNDRRDLKSVQQMISVDVSKRLDPFNSYYYDVGQDCAIKLRPVPDRTKLIETFHNRLGKKKRFI